MMIIRLTAILLALGFLTGCSDIDPRTPQEKTASALVFNERFKPYLPKVVEQCEKYVDTGVMGDLSKAGFTPGYNTNNVYNIKMGYVDLKGATQAPSTEPDLLNRQYNVKVRYDKTLITPRGQQNNRSCKLFVTGADERAGVLLIANIAQFYKSRGFQPELKAVGKLRFSNNRTSYQYYNSKLESSIEVTIEITKPKK